MSTDDRFKRALHRVERAWGEAGAAIGRFDVDTDPRVRAAYAAGLRRALDILIEEDAPVKERAAADQLTRRVMHRIGVAQAGEWQCPRESTPTVACVARHGVLAVLDEGSCAGCGQLPSVLLAAEKAKGHESAKGHGPAER
jgi:hypothetical protein